MRVVVQRVSKASVLVGTKKISTIYKGLLVFLGIEVNDAEKDVLWIANKVTSLRIFPDNEGVMNKSVLDIDGEVLVVSQFTLHAKTKKGNRPSYIKALKGKEAIFFYEKFLELLVSKMGEKVFSGHFGADMQVELINDGPVTILIDSKNKE